MKFFTPGVYRLYADDTQLFPSFPFFIIVFICACLFNIFAWIEIDKKYPQLSFSKTKVMIFPSRYIQHSISVNPQRLSPQSLLEICGLPLTANQAPKGAWWFSTAHSKTLLLSSLMMEEWAA